MSAALMTAQSGSTAAPARMNYIEIINRFWQLDTEQKFAPNATRLYFFLAAECNRQRWKNPFHLADAYLCMVLRMPKNTMKPARAELVERGIIAYQPGGNGAGDTAVYALQSGQEIAPLKVSKSDPLLMNKGSGMVSDFDPLPADKGSDKVSDFDPTIYKEKTKTSSVVENEEEAASPSLAPVEKKITTQPASKSPEPQTPGARRGGAFDAPEECTSAEQSPLSKPEIFKAICIDEGYPEIDFEHYRREILNTSRDEQLRLPARDWRKRIRRWLSNDKRSKSGLVLATGTPRPAYGAQPTPTRASGSIAAKATSQIKL